MKKLAISLLIVLLSLNSFAQESSDEDVIITVDPLENQRVGEYSHPNESITALMNSHLNKQKEFNARGIELFDQAINDSARYRMIIQVNGQKTHEEAKNIQPDRTSGSIAKGFLEQMQLANSGQSRTADGDRLSFKCEQDSVLARLPVFRLFIKPGRCQLKLITYNAEQIQTVKLSFVMELTDTAEHKNWPSKIISPEIKLEIEAKDRLGSDKRSYQN
jgi:hypothetical protein